MKDVTKQPLYFMHKGSIKNKMALLYIVLVVLAFIYCVYRVEVRASSPEAAVSGILNLYLYLIGALGLGAGIQGTGNIFAKNTAVARIRAQESLDNGDVAPQRENEEAGK